MTEHLDDATLASFREGLLAEREAAGARAHLSGCARCRQRETQFGHVTALLAASAPPPMPPSVSARIEAALAAETAARAAAAPTAVTATGPGPRSAPGPGRGAAGSGPAAGRPPRRPGRALARSRARLQLMAAAAAIVVAGGGGYAVVQLTAQGGGTSSAGSTAAGPRAASPAGSAALEGPNRPAAGEATVSPVASGTDYTRGRFGSQVRAVLARYPAGGAGRVSGAARALAGSGLPGCLRAVTGGKPVRLVDVARYQRRPALIIVAGMGGGGTLHAWAVGRDCSAARPHVLSQLPVPAAG